MYDNSTRHAEEKNINSRIFWWYSTSFLSGSSNEQTSKADTIEEGEEITEEERWTDEPTEEEVREHSENEVTTVEKKDEAQSLDEGRRGTNIPMTSRQNNPLRTLVTRIEANEEKDKEFKALFN